jgi:hypothetical protein
MSRINTVIQPQAFEIVRDRIGRILTEEVDNQFQISYRLELKVTSWIERFLQFDKTELPAINVTLGEGSYEGQTAIQSDGTYRFYIDCYVNAKSSDKNPGDSKAMRKLHALLGVCRAIIMDPRYVTLGFSVRPGFIMNRHFDNLQIENPRQKEHDADSSVMGRLVLSVKVPEITGNALPTNLVEFFTQVKLADTEKGYQWIRDSGGVFDYSFDNSFPHN